uniref:type I restriction-modification system subunit M N-terminal domain-containing protein n=1 Tax=Corallococcus coralloides TaxID=184914 RepID=UPI0013E89E7D|nr:type I restriction-modification system subunit M N-terminal domain-containing protein [Corallococcus coralloides]
MLSLLKREELQAICEALGLDRGGREKEVLVQRILNLGELDDGTGPAASEDASVADLPQEGMRKRARTEKSGGDLGFEATLWQAADKLRNNLDAAEYKHVVLGLIFLKYVSGNRSGGRGG